MVSIATYLKSCSQALKYGCEGYFSAFPALRFGIKLMAPFIKPLPDLPESPNARLLYAIREGDFVLRSFLRFLALYPELCGISMSDLFLQLLIPDFSFTQKDLQEAMDKDFPGAGADFWGNDVPAKVFPPSLSALYDERVEELRFIIRYMKNTGKQSAVISLLEKFETCLIAGVDLRRQALCLEKMKNHFQQDTFVFVPAVKWLKSAQQIITYEPFECENYAVTQETGLLLARAAVTMVLRDGFYMVFLASSLGLQTGKLVIKAGLYFEELTFRERAFIKNVVIALLTKDYNLFARSIQDTSFWQSTDNITDVAAFVKDAWEESSRFSLSYRIGCLIEKFGKRDIDFPLSIRRLYACAESVEQLSGNNDIWSEVAEDVYRFLNWSPDDVKTDAVLNLAQKALSAKSTAQ